MKEDGDTWRRRWAKELVRASPKSASIESKNAFAESVLSRVGTAIPQAWRARHNLALRKPLRDKLESLRVTLNEIRAAVKRDQPGAHAVGLTTYALDKTSKPLKLYAKPILDRLSYELAPLERERRGKNNQAEIVYARMIAKEYRTHFGKAPGLSKDVNNPFGKLCGVVSLLVTELGHPLQIGAGARLKAAGEMKAKK